MLVRDADVWTQYTVCYPPRRSELGAAEPPHGRSIGNAPRLL